MKRGNLLGLLVVLALGAQAGLAGSVKGKVTPGKSVVYLESASGAVTQVADKKVTMDQKGLLFQPHILVVQAGTTVDFLNSDKVAHNVFWPSLMQGSKKLPGKNLGTWPQGEKRPFKFDQSGVASLLCNVHPEMAGYIVISPTPYFAKTDKGGAYKIDNVPDGQYNVVAWHEGAKNSSKAVSVSGDTK